MSTPRQAPAIGLEVPEESISNDDYYTDTTQGSEDSVIDVEFVIPRKTISYYFCCCKLLKRNT